MLSYSIAIRTLGTAGDKFRKELESIRNQTIQPDKVIVYIANGYERPDFTVGKEEYVWVKKGMMSQRIQSYKEIESDCIMMLDDDVELTPESAELMLNAMEDNNADCIGIDTFRNHEMAFPAKIYAIISNLVFPHYNNRWAFIVRRNGSFSYNNKPKRSFYLSQSCAGPASMWRKNVYEALELENELWLDDFEFAYGEDMLEFYKLYVNGYKLGVLFNTGIKNLDGGTSSVNYRKSPQRIYTRTKASFVIWWRLCYEPSGASMFNQIFTVYCFILKLMWLCLVMAVYSLYSLRSGLVGQYFKGIRDGWRFVKSAKYKSIRSYKLNGITAPL